MTPRSYDAVVFDMDGVITDTARIHRDAWKHTFDAFLRTRAVGGSASARGFSERDYLEYVDGKHRQDGVASFLTSRGISMPLGQPEDPPDAGTIWGLANRKNREFQATVADHGVSAFPSSVAFVHELQALGIGTAIISASRNAQQVLEAAGIGSLFPVRVDGIDAERLGLAGKPSPAVFLEAARRLRVQPPRAVVVEDAIAGVEAGSVGGFGLVVGVNRAGDAEALRAHGADVVVTDLGELGVDRITGRTWSH